MGKRHLTPAEIKEQCKRIARESRMADRTPWTAMGIICSYVIMRREGFKGQRISRLANKVNEMEADWSAGKVDLKEISKQLMNKAGWSIEYKAYTEDDITARKGSYQYWLDQKQIAPQNTINEQATRYMLFFFTALMDEYGFGKDRLTRVEEYMNELLLQYQEDKTTVREWSHALLTEAGVIMEPPVDPLTQTTGKHYDGVIMMEFYKLFHWRKDWPEMLSMEKVLMSGELHARCAEKMRKIDQLIIGAYMMSILLSRN